MGEFFESPILVDNRGNLRFQEVPDPAQQGLVLLAQGRVNGVKIAIGLRKCLRDSNTHGRFLLIDGFLTMACECKRAGDKPAPLLSIYMSLGRRFAVDPRRPQAPPSLPKRHA